MELFIAAVSLAALTWVSVPRRLPRLAPISARIRTRRQLAAHRELRG